MKKTLLVIGLFLGILVLIGILSAPKRQPSAALEDKGRDLYEPRLASVIQKEEGCEVSRVFYNGWKADNRQFFWSVECRDGRQFLVSVEGETGKVKTLSCDVARAVNVICFEKWK